MVTQIPSCRRKAFSLIELLTVITVVAILASLLIPSFFSARSKGRAALCVSNQRQVSVAYNIKEFNDKNRLFHYKDTYMAFWPVLEPYGISIDNNFCPETQKVRPLELLNEYSTIGNVAWPWASSGKKHFGSYFFNGWVFDVSKPHTNPPWNGKDLSSFFGTHLGQINDVSSVPLASDGIWVDGWPEFGQSLPPRSQWDQSDPLVDNGNLPGEADYRRITINRHMEKQAVGYMDGHAGLVRIVDIPKLKWSANHPTTPVN